ncbi:MAG: twin-arginine translocase TatA/TatE family subunit [Chloroflexota bacterium]|nr:twin-arginine translocase TatA/TatE family subunit [Chloroflexota bacterium]
MRIGPLGIPELLIILLVIMLIFGAKRLPEIGSSLGKGIRTFKSSVTGEDEEKPTVGAETAGKTDEENRYSGF